MCEELLVELSYVDKQVPKSSIFEVVTEKLKVTSNFKDEI